LLDIELTEEEREELELFKVQVKEVVAAIQKRWDSLKEEHNDRL
jgi:dsDNA-binding SOS-regulon protein